MASYSLAVVTLAAATGCTFVPDLPIPSNCDAPTRLFVAADILADVEHPCFEWLDTTHGRLADAPNGSAVVWTVRTSSRAALVVSALHTVRQGLLAPADSEVEERLVDPSVEIAFGTIQVFDPGGVELAETHSPTFLLYHPAASGQDHAEAFQNLRPRNDFFLTVADDQMLDRASPESAGALRAASPGLYDPRMIADSPMPIASVVPGELVLLEGFPSSLAVGLTRTPRLGASVGRALSDAEAEEIVSMLREAGDEEGEIAYDADAEMIIEGEASPGMSGGGVFNRDGRLVGIIVRVTEAHSLPIHTRAVRLTYIKRRIEDALDALPDREQAAVSAFLAGM